MRRLIHRTRTVVATLLTAAFVSACSDSAFSPTPMPNRAALSGADASAAKSSTRTATSGTSDGSSSTSSQGSKVTVLTFKSGVRTNVAASKIIGVEGGYLTLAETGFTLFVPAGAVSVPTTFRVTPVGGNLVAYDFEPHGTTFAVPLTFSQDLSRTNFVSGRTTRGAYFSDKTKIDAQGGTADVSELFTLSFDQFGWSFFSIKHFSGYLVAMG